MSLISAQASRFVSNNTASPSVIFIRPLRAISSCSTYRSRARRCSAVTGCEHRTRHGHVFLSRVSVSPPNTSPGPTVSTTASTPSVTCNIKAAPLWITKRSAAVSPADTIDAPDSYTRHRNAPQKRASSIGAMSVQSGRRCCSAIDTVCSVRMPSVWASSSSPNPAPPAALPTPPPALVEALAPTPASELRPLVWSMNLIDEKSRMAQASFTTACRSASM